MNTSEILNTAADLIERGGWTQGSYKDGPRFCAEGAIIQAAQPGFWEPRPYGECGVIDLHTLAAVGVFQHWIGLPSIPNWNDHPERTKGQVVAALRAASLAPVAFQEDLEAHTVKNAAGQVVAFLPA